jgi:membrane associated rhomboid family serine protease
VQGVQIHVCRQCGGILYTSDAFREHVAILRDSPLQELPTSELFDRQVIPEKAIAPEGKMCPRCGDRMSPYNYAYDSNIILDKCSKCQLIWADKGEIIKIGQYVKGNPTLERLGAALADREAERARYQDMVEEAAEFARMARPVSGFRIGFLPLSDDAETHTFPLVTALIILLNVLLFLALPQSEETFDSLGFIPALFFAGKELHRIVTSEFVHIGFGHLFGNMLFLWIFGDNVEGRFRRVPFFLAYLFFGIVASLTHAITTSDQNIPCVGASGAISGVMGAYFILFPQARVRTVIGHYVVPLPAFVFLGVWFLMQLLFSAAESSIAYFAHIGGFVIGAIVAFAWKAVRKNHVDEK